MISSKKLTLIGLVLTAATIIFTVAVMLLPGKIISENAVGTVTYSDSHSVTFSDDDYRSNYSEGSAARIELAGSTATSKSKNVSVDGSEITILGGGTYVISGELTDGNIVVDSTDGGEVRLVLNGAKITSSDFSALYVKQAKKTVLSLVEGTENYLTDGIMYSEEKAEDDRPTAALYSRDDLTINGGGSLTVTANYMDGIKVNDALKITEGSLKVTAADEGINANDYIAFLAAAVEVNAGGDAVKCENESADKGFIAFEGTKLLLAAGDDGIYSSSSVYLSDAAAEISAGGDAIHAGLDAVINPKTLAVTKSREGIEGAYITINGGDISIVSSDDGINAVGENSSGSFLRPVGMHKENITDEDIYLTINGGNICIETSGDGVDSNGAAKVNGGNIQIYGPENNGNSSLDFEYGFVINGGSLLAAGSKGMAEVPHETSGQHSIAFYLNEACKAGSVISVTNSEGNEIIRGTSNKSFDWVCVSTADLVTGEKYTLKINDNEINSAEVTDVVTFSGNNGGGRR